LACNSRVQEFLGRLTLFKNKKCTIPFKLEKWLKAIIETPSEEPAELNIWYRNPTTLKAHPRYLHGKILFSKKGKIKSLLLSIYDRTLRAHADEQKRLMQTAFNNFNGQFIANEKGYIIHPNESFIEMSGLSAEQLQKMTLMHWLDLQITLNSDTTGLLRTLLETKFWSGEVELHPSPDLTFHAILTISMIADDDFNIEHYIVTLQNITDIKEAQAQLQQMAFYDSLTGLANRKLAKELISNALKNHQRYKNYSAILYINLERFKSINNAFGRKTGDQLLTQTALSLKKLLRKGDALARVGGDEFAVISQDRATDTESATRNALKLAHKISNKLNQHYLVGELSLHSSVRIGMIVYPFSEDDNADTLLNSADLAMSEAKNLKANEKIYIYEPTLSEDITHRRQLEIDLNSPELDSQLQLYYQAQIGKGDVTHGAETLIRWKHPTLGFVPPNKFIAIAEESRQILKVGAWVLYHAFMQIKKWTATHPNFNLSINISPIQFHEAEFVKHIRELLNHTDVNPSNITLELTEGVLISDTESALNKIEKLDRLGFKISIDDFGTGYSSLSYLQRLPIHELKIDKSFIFRVPESKEDIAIVESIIRLAQTKNLTIVAEGVETQQQVDFLRKQPDNILIQGFFYSRPIEAEVFEKKFLNPDS
jgi:diguanylate cyclase (GGDEF)-like protein/PAS domain S-box-containing protein